MNTFNYNESKRETIVHIKRKQKKYLKKIGSVDVVNVFLSLLYTEPPTHQQKTALEAGWKCILCENSM